MSDGRSCPGIRELPEGGHKQFLFIHLIKCRKIITSQEQLKGISA
jgi:hypothetical protein